MLRSLTVLTVALAALVSGVALAEDTTAVEITFEAGSEPVTATHALAYHGGGTTTTVMLSDTPVTCQGFKGGKKPTVGGQVVELTLAQPVGQGGVWKVTTVRAGNSSAEAGLDNPHTVTVKHRGEDGATTATVKLGSDTRVLATLSGTIQAKGCGINPRYTETDRSKAHAHSLSQRDLTITYAGEPVELGCAYLSEWSNGKVRLELSTNACYTSLRKYKGEESWECELVSPPLDVMLSFHNVTADGFDNINGWGERVSQAQFEPKGWSFALGEPMPNTEEGVVEPPRVEVRVKGSATDDEGRDLVVDGTITALDCR